MVVKEGLLGEVTCEPRCERHKSASHVTIWELLGRGPQMGKVWLFSERQGEAGSCRALWASV